MRNSGTLFLPPHVFLQKLELPKQRLSGVELNDEGILLSYREKPLRSEQHVLVSTSRVLEVFGTPQDISIEKLTYVQALDEIMLTLSSRLEKRKLAGVLRTH